MIDDPMEALIARALDDRGIAYDRHHPAALDFYLPAYDVHIEVKRMHSDRIAKQTARVDNVIVAQGVGGVELLAWMVGQMRRDS